VVESESLITRDSEFADLPLAVVMQIDRLADDFEAAFRSGAISDPSAYVEQLGDSNETARAVLANHLVEIQSELSSSGRLRSAPATVCDDGVTPPANTAARVPIAAPVAAVDPSSPRTVPLRRIELGERPLQVGEYQLLEKLGSGGMGVVYKALHVRLQRFVAIKFPRFAAVLDPQSAARFFREAKLVGRLRHPNIVMALDAGASAYGPYLVTEFIAGETLEALVRRTGPLPIETAVKLATQAASGLGYAHAHGIVHRDVKPSNMLLDGTGALRVVDFGLAKLLADEHRTASSIQESHQTQCGAFLGTVGYAAPEQLGLSQAIDQRADIYALGCVLFFMLIGEPPHKGSLADRLLAGRQLKASSLRSRDGAVPRRFEKVWERMVASAPQRRFLTMADVERSMHDALAAGANGLQSAMPRRAALACLAAGGLTLWGIYGPRSSRLRTQPKPAPSGPPPSPAVAPFNAAQAFRHQQAWAEYLGQPVRLVNMAGMPFMLLPPGEFMMGMSKAPLPEPALPVDDWRSRDPEVVRQEQLPRHRVVLTKPLYFGATEVTNEQFRRFVDATGYVTDAERSAGWGKEDRGWLKRAGYSWKNMGQRLCEDDYCVINVTWNDSVALSAWLNEHDDHGTCRLPTEAEWEFACRAGSTTNYWFGNDATELVEHAWFAANSQGRFQPVGLKRPNPFGIYDMYGNRQEWCLDHYAADFYRASPVENPVCETSNSTWRAMRGGTHTDMASFCTSAQRWSQEANNPGAAGIRMVCELFG
jgi:eukaryotic-like serine/threonine-protein kinase